MSNTGTPAKVGSNDELGPLPPQLDGQAKFMTISESEIGRDIEISRSEVGHWYSPEAVRELLAAERHWWERTAEAMAQEADRKFPLDGTVAIWLRALLAKRGA
jgi:hypothetical protein